MGQVIAIKDITAAPILPPPDEIDLAYAALAKLPGFFVRDSQKTLSRDICRALIDSVPLAAEAPTGTGKTLAYLIGALAASEQLSRAQGKIMPVIVATATNGLQQQILSGDLPRLVEAGLLAADDGLLAKGRNRYFCVASAERLVSDTNRGGQFDIFDEVENQNIEDAAEVSEMLEHFFGRAWDGDQDTYTGMPPLAWDRVKASSDTCVGRRCEHFEHCPFFRERAKLSYARVIIANHDLVLSDLLMAQNEQEPLFPSNRYLAIFDEAHHLPDKAIDAGSAHIELNEAMQALVTLPPTMAKVFRERELAKLLQKKQLQPEDFDPTTANERLRALVDMLRAVETDPETQQCRYQGGLLPEHIAEQVGYCQFSVEKLKSNVAELTNQLKSTNLGDKQPALKPVIADFLYQLSWFNSRYKEIATALALFGGLDRSVRWHYCTEHQVSIHTSPLEGADVLKKLLWAQPRVVPALVSATMRTFETFERFQARVGLPEDARTSVVPPVFAYHKSDLIIARMTHSPRMEQRTSFIEELREAIPEFLRQDEASLILFPSRHLMREVLPAIQTAYPGKVLAQGEQSFKTLISRHKAAADKGEGTILCGLATMAEGLDLPGHYCTHVIIVALPFTVPTSPVEQELQEVLGERYFGERALPDALTRLVQMVGRLIRRESDVGRITVLDRRLRDTKWGRRMLDSLPPFRKRTERLGDRQKINR